MNGVEIKMKKVVAYYRVSTNDQNLGIEAQKSIVKQYCVLNSAEIISEYEEMNPVRIITECSWLLHLKRLSRLDHT